MPEETQPGLRIASVQIENVKSVKAFHMEPTPLGLTIVGGKNGQGKTSVLDAIAWVLGGAKKAPSKAARNGAMSDPSISLTLSNGIRVERKGKNSTLTVIDPMGKRSGQALLDAFVSEFALDLPKFMDASNRDKAQILLRILGVGDQLAKLDMDEARLYAERHSIGQTANAKAKHAEELPEFPDVPTEPLSISELIMRQQATLAKNGENQRKRDAAEHYEMKLDAAAKRLELAKKEVAAATEDWAKALNDHNTASASAMDLNDESTAELEQQIADFESLNAQIAPSPGQPPRSPQTVGPPRAGRSSREWSSPLSGTDTRHGWRGAGCTRRPRSRRTGPSSSCRPGPVWRSHPARRPRRSGQAPAGSCRSSSGGPRPR